VRQYFLISPYAACSLYLVLSHILWYGSYLWQQILDTSIVIIVNPIGNCIITASLAKFGTSYIAGLAVIGRLTPVFFAFIFSLSSAIGPIIGQNHGAMKRERIKEIIYNTLFFIIMYCVLISFVLYLAQNTIIDLFGLTGNGQLVVRIFCSYMSFIYIFNGAQFISNTAFNSLGKPMYAAILNIIKATLGTILFVFFGEICFGAVGVLYGSMAGTVFFGVLSILVLHLNLPSILKSSD